MLRMSSPYDPSQQQGQPSTNPYEQPGGQQTHRPGSSTRPPGSSTAGGSADTGHPGPVRPAARTAQSYGVATQEHPQGTMVFVLGIVGHLRRCPRPDRLVPGQQDAARDHGLRRLYSNESQIQTGRMLGKVFTIIYIVFIVLYIIVLIVLFGLLPLRAISIHTSGLRRGRRPSCSAVSARCGEICTAAEIGLQLPRTQALVTGALAELGLEITLGRELTSVVGVLRAARRTPAPAVLLRADMDALPVTEETGEPFAAPPGVMHACGHDLHTAALVGAAMLLSRHRDELPGDVVFMFQPGEEGHDGAAAMIAEGVLDAAGPRVSAAYGLHVFSSPLPRGVFATRPGPLMAASSACSSGCAGWAGTPLGRTPAADPDRGRGGDGDRAADHGHPAVRPVRPGAGHGRALPGRHPAQRDPRQRHLRGHGAGVRARAGWPGLQDRCVRLCTQIAAAHGLQADVSFTGEYPVTVNDPTTRTSPSRWRPICSDRTGRYAAGPGHGLGGLLPGAGRGARCVRLPRRLCHRRPGHRAHQPLRARPFRRVGAARTPRCCSPSWPGGGWTALVPVVLGRVP